MAINWFPGHMVAAQKKAAEALADIDVDEKACQARVHRLTAQIFCQFD